MAEENTKNPIPKADYEKKAQYKVVVPTNLADQTSKTSYCEDCFQGQAFSKRLQFFMIDYSIKVSSKNPLTDKR